MKKPILWGAALVLLLVLAGVGYRMLSARTALPAVDAAVQGSASSAAEPVPLPDFTVVDADGNTVSSDSFAGKPTVINFWATWCAYCKKEMPDFQAAYEAYGDRINFVMIDAVDGGQETVEQGRQYVADNGFTFPVYFDTEMEAVLSCGVTGFPATLFVSAGGEVLLGWPGYLENDQLIRMLEAML